ncbi:MAG: hypothetical protein WD178_08650 [Actinomycetota bacterium]
MRKHLSIAVLMFVLLLSGCSNPDSAAPDPAEETTDTPVAGQPSVDVIMSEYGYAISGTMAAGGTMKVQNVGSELHMIGTGKLREGRTIQNVLAAFEGDGDLEEALEGLVDEVEGPMGGTYMPGKAVELTFAEEDFAPGEYVFICFLPSVGDGAPHAAKGMVAEFTVGEGEVQTPTPDATYALAAGEPIEGPATLTPGRHVIEITATADGEDLEPALLKLAPGKTFADIDAAFGQVFGEEPPQGGYVELLPISNSFFLHDLAGVKRMFVTVDLEPGDYLMTAHNSDTEEPVTDPTEKIAITVG